MRVGSSFDLIVEAARRRGVVVDVWPDVVPAFGRLRHAAHQEFLYHSAAGTSRGLHELFTNKMLTSEVLRRGDWLVPASILTTTVAEGEHFLGQYSPMVCKPVHNTWGRGVTPGITQVADLVAAWKWAQQNNIREGERRVLCEHHVDGTEYRVLVINQQEVFSVLRRPAAVEGDGQHTVRELAARNPRIVIDERLEQLLVGQGFDLAIVPAQGQTVRLARVANAHAGGSVCDATDDLGASVVAEARRLAAYFSAPIVGIDCISPDIGRTLGSVIELNSTPDLTLHHYPSEGKPRDAAGAIVTMLFPETYDVSPTR